MKIYKVNIWHRVTDYKMPYELVKANSEQEAENHPYILQKYVGNDWAICAELYKKRLTDSKSVLQ